MVAVGLVVTACDGFLEESPRGSLNPDLLADEQGIEALLVGAYSSLNPAGGDGTLAIGGGSVWEASPDNWVFGSIMGGDAKKGTDASDQPPINPIMVGDVAPTNQYLDSYWKAYYEGVTRTNEVLSVLEQAEDIPEDERARIAAEARFLRGHFYFYLKKVFNMVPWIDETVEDTRVPNDQDIWPNIEDDFQFAMDNLPETQGEVGRVNNWAAAAYLAKTYVYQEKWDEAKALYDDIIANGQTADGQAYGLAESYEDNFHPDRQNNQESVFAIQMTSDDGSGGIAHSRPGNMLNYPYNSPFRCCGFYQPSQELVNSFQTEDGVPLIDAYNDDPVRSDASYDQDASSDELFDVHEGPLDPRLDWTVGRRGVPYLNWGPHPGSRWIRDPGYAGTFAPKKHVYRQGAGHQNDNSWAPGTAVNHHVIRFADVLLMAAEAEANLGNFDQAQDYVNEVRERAQNPEGFVSNEDNLEYAAATVTSEAELADVDVDVDDWVVNTEDNVTYVLIDDGTWQTYPNPEDNYEVALYDEAWSSEEEALERIRHERKLELAMEGHRFFDLVRWGIFEDELNEYFDYEGSLTSDVRGGSVSERNAYYPIPQRQIDLSTVDGEPTLEQNPGY